MKKASTKGSKKMLSAPYKETFDEDEWKNVELVFLQEFFFFFFPSSEAIIQVHLLSEVHFMIYP